MNLIDDILHSGDPLPESGDAFNRDRYLARSVLRLRDRFGCKVALETGTFHGVTTAWLAQHFKQVRSAEVNEEFLKVAQQRLDQLPNVLVALENSVTALHRWLSET